MFHQFYYFFKSWQIYSHYNTYRRRIHEQDILFIERIILAKTCRRRNEYHTMMHNERIYYIYTCVYFKHILSILIYLNVLSRVWHTSYLSYALVILKCDKAWTKIIHPLKLMSVMVNIFTQSLLYLNNMLHFSSFCHVEMWCRYGRNISSFNIFSFSICSVAT